MLNKILIRFDIVLAITGLGVGLATIFISEYFGLNRTHLGYGITIACLGYFLFIKVLGQTTSVTPSAAWQTSTPIFLWLTSLFFVLLIISIVVVRVSLYERPPIYFGFFMGAMTMLALEVGLLDCNPAWKQRTVLGQILLLSVSFSAGAFFLYPSVSGVDPFFHQQVADELISTGKIPVTGYSPFPFTHLLIGSFSLVSGSSSKMGLFFISIWHAVALLSIFSMGKMLFDVRTGLLAAILLSFSDYQLQWSVQVIPMTIGIILFILILTALFKRKVAQKPGEKLGWTTLIILFSGVMIITHTLTTLILFFTLLVITILSVLIRFIKTHLKNVVVSSTLTLLVGVATLSYWMASFLQPKLDFFSLVVLSINSALSTVEMGNVESISSAGSFDTWSIFAGEAGWIGLLIFSLMGALASFRADNKPIRLEDLILTFLMGIFLFITYGASVVGAVAILPARWISFLYIPTSLLAAQSLAKLLTGETKYKIYIRFIILSSVLLTLAFQITSPAKSDPDSPLYAPSLGARPGFYASELVAMEHAKNRYNDVVGSFKSRLYLNTTKILDPSRPASYQTVNMIVLRQYDILKGFLNPSGNKALELVFPTQEFFDYLNGPTRLRIYDNGTVQLFLSSIHLTPEFHQNQAKE